MRREGDVVLIYYEDRPAVFARIEAIMPDIKKGWYRVGLLLLTLPPHPATWILRDEYVNGEPFTMGGKAVRLEEVKRAEFREAADRGPGGRKGEGAGKGKIVPFKIS
jgi:hypothetical protein